MLTLSNEQRLAVRESGAPLPFFENGTEMAYMLLNIELIADSEGGSFIARIPTINAFGEGDTKEAAALALCEALRGVLDASEDK